MFGRTRKIAPAIATTRTDYTGRIVAVTFTDGAMADIARHGAWESNPWAAPMTAAHWTVVYALAA